MSATTKQFRKQFLICGCCGEYFYTWPTYVDQDQDKGYGTCIDCQYSAAVRDQQQVLKAAAVLRTAMKKPENIAKFDAMTYEDMRLFVWQAIDDGILTWGFNK